MDHKQTTGFTTKLDADQGIVETVFAVMGNVDQGNDIIHNGAFTKTFSERGRKVRVLDQHRTDSVLRVIGKPVAFREMSRDELPGSLLDEYPDATGGAWAKIQFLMDTPEGEGAFKRIKSGAISEWSFGYDALDFDHSTVRKDDADITVRNLKTIKLYELSPVLFGMNPATTTLSAKEDAGEGGEDTVDAEPEDDDKAAEPPVMPNLDPAIYEGIKAALVEILADAGIDLHELKGDEAPVGDLPQAADTMQEASEQAGPGAGTEPDAPPTSNDRLRLEIEVELLELERLEV